MTASLTIVVLFHHGFSHRRINKYAIYTMIRYWRSQGNTVHCLFGTDDFVPADVCLLHVDLSVVPEKYVEFAHRYPVTLNGRITDIRKQTISKNLLNKGDDYAGKVIVKTNLNYGGWPEKVATSNYPSLLARKAVEKIRLGLNMRAGNISSQKDYRIYDNLSMVPARYIDSPNYVIEKFLPEIRLGQYCVNFYKFFGSRHQCIKLYSHKPVVLASSEILREEIALHPDVLDYRNEMGIDFGKIDYCIHDGRMVVIDVNKTLGVPDVTLSGFRDPGEEWAASLEEFL